MKKKILAIALLAPSLFACSALSTDNGTDEAPTPAPADKRLDPPAPPAPETPSNPMDMGKEGTTSELIEALRRGTEPVFVVLREGTKLGKDAEVGPNEHVAARAVRLENDTTLVIELLQGSDDRELEVALSAARYLKEIDFVRLGAEVQKTTVHAVEELDDFEIDEEARRAATFNGLTPNAAPDFDCIARFSQISASRDFIPFPLSNCSAPQDPVGDPERIADAQQAKKVAQNIYNQMLKDYQNAQAQIAILTARLQAIQNAYVFIRHDPHFKEYNILHFKDFIHGRKVYNDRYERAEKLLVAAALATQAQLAVYRAVPPPDANVSRSQANVIVARKWNCTLKQGLLNNGGRSGSVIVGVSLETLGAPFVDIQVMLDDQPPLPQKDGWGGLFDVTATKNLPSDVTRLAVEDFVPVRASVGLPIVMFRFQPLDAKKTRPVGKACNLRAGLVL